MNSKSVGRMYAEASEFKWTLNTDNFISKKQGDKLLSPVFYTRNSSQDLKWRLCFYPKGGESSRVGCMSVYLQNLNDFSVEVKFEFSLVNRHGEKVNKASSSTKDLIESGISRGFVNFVEESFVWITKNNVIEDNDINILCTITESISIFSNEDLINSNQFNTCERLFANQKYSDVIVTTEDKNFHLHKCILATHSVVFEKMFEVDMKEKNESLVEIDDIKSEVLNEFFQYLYSGKVNDIEKMVCDLLYAADKYLVENLKDICEKIMSSRINMDNAINYLEIAEKNNAKKLKKNIITYIASNLKNFTDNSDFETFSVERPELLFEIMKIIGEEMKVLKI